MTWRRLVNILAPIVLAYWVLWAIIEDKALWAALFTALFTANLMLDLVKWTDERWER